MRSFSNVEEYANFTGIDLATATIRFHHFRNVKEKIKTAIICPNCKTPSLQLNSGNTSENGLPFVFCTNEIIDCDFKSDITENFEILTSEDTIDAVVEMAPEHPDTLQSLEQQLGISWKQFVQQDTMHLLEKQGAIRIRTTDESQNSSGKDGVLIVGTGSRSRVLAELIHQLPSIEEAPIALDSGDYPLYKPTYFTQQKEEKHFYAKSKKTKKQKKRKR